ncbi:MAG: hypothetical protein ABJF11_03330 [Reichenbachiella sp.]|uniref:hypothetical protein n=1 Tax=Reichenbachiella sp. TaxID=2184521 RepID=UPI003266D694
MNKKNYWVFIMLLFALNLLFLKNLLTDMANTNEMKKSYQIFEYDVKLLLGEATLPINTLENSINKCDSIQLEIDKCKKKNSE